MPTLRLLDDNGYTVPGSVCENVSAADEAKVRDHLKNSIAVQHAAEWATDARLYQVATDPTT